MQTMYISYYYKKKKNVYARLNFNETYVLLSVEKSKFYDVYRECVERTYQIFSAANRRRRQTRATTRHYCGLMTMCGVFCSRVFILSYEKILSKRFFSVSPLQGLNFGKPPSAFVPIDYNVKIYWPNFIRVRSAVLTRK